MQCSRAHNISSDSKLFIWSAFLDQIYPPDMKCTRWHVHCILRSDIPPPPPLGDEVIKMQCISITHMHALYRFRHTPLPPGIWSAQDDMYMHITYACTVQMQTYPPDQLDSGMRYQLLLWDEVYRLWYFNDHITTLVISEKLLYDIYWRYKETNQDFPSILQQVHIYRHGNIRYGKSMKEYHTFIYTWTNLYISITG